mmetsp:Transcript_31650/g.48409  ORF Transcript_31650/g.48409 Transcript_31650/m.48409 type:complete len:113 (-) Transcript_31650:1128-1466(-)
MDAKKKAELEKQAKEELKRQLLIKAAQEKARKEKEAREAKLKAEREAAEKKAKAEREAAIAKAKAEAEARRQAKLRAEAEARERAEEEERAKLDGMTIGQITEYMRAKDGKK